jgi:chromosomal replication initiation ATPase DnaA
MVEWRSEAEIGRNRAAAVQERELEPVARSLGAVVAAAFGLRLIDVVRAGTRGPANVAFARQVAMYLAHTRLGISHATTGRLFGRDRTTARHACRRVEDRREDPRVDSLLDCLERAVDLSADLARYGDGGAAHA